jgi:FMN phosphatase YigB (HAD superfamily)
MEKPAFDRKLPFDALVFDVGGIFILHDNEQLFRRLAEACSALDALSRIQAAAADPLLTTGGRSISVLYRDIVRDLGYARDEDAFFADWCSHFTADGDMLALLDTLAQSNRVVLFSNTNAVHWDYVTQLMGGALAPYEAYLSHEIGDRKPLASAFRSVAARAGLAPERSLFVDDLAENVAVAEAVGFRGHVFIDQDEFERFLATL